MLNDKLGTAPKSAPKVGPKSGPKAAQKRPQKYQWIIDKKDTQ